MEKKELLACTIDLESGFTHVLFNLAAQGYSHIRAIYSGSGDSGAIHELLAIKRGGVIEEGDDLPTLTKGAETIELEYDLAELISNKIYDILNNASDWYNNEGGGGTLFISTDDYKYKGDHYYNVIHEEHEELDGTIGDN
jgi:hypothetical protein